MEPLGGDVARELSRFGPVSGLAPLVEAWPGAVGPEIARNAWPARVGRDGALHVHAKDSIWAFELTSRVREIRGRLGDLAPPRIIFVPGPLPERVESEPESARKRLPNPTAEQIAKAASLARGIRDEELRKVVGKTIALSLSGDVNDRSFW